MDQNYSHFPRVDLGTGPMGYGLDYKAREGDEQAKAQDTATDAGQGDEAKASVSDEAQVMALVEWLKAKDIEVPEGQTEASTVLGMLDATIHNLAWIKGALARELEAPLSGHTQDLVLAMIDENRKLRMTLARAIKAADQDRVPGPKRIDSWRDALTRPWMAPFVARIGVGKDGVPFISFADERPEDHV